MWTIGSRTGSEVLSVFKKILNLKLGVVSNLKTKLELPTRIGGSLEKK
jgi:hypothetical protein